MKIIKGDSLVEQMRFVDTMLSRLVRKSQKIVKVLIPPCPISNYIDIPIDDIVFKYMFPAGGTLTGGYLAVDNMPKGGVDLIIEINTDGAVKSETVSTKGSSTSLSVKSNLSVSAGSRLTVRVVAKVEDSELSGIWVALLWTPKIKDSLAKKFLIDELDKLEKSG
jgi:hypothetical protein